MTRADERGLAPHRGGRGPVGGFLDGMAGRGAEIVPLPFILPGLGGAVTEDAQAWVETQFLQALANAGPLDGVFLQLHGAGAGVRGGDCEGGLCAALREQLRESVPIIAVVDGHANVSARLFESTTALIGVKTNPHYDFYERGQQAARIAFGALREGLKVTTAVAQPPMLASLQKQRIAPGWPMEDLVRMGASRLRDNPRVLDVTVIGGWPYADCSHAGFSVLVATADASDLAEAIATEIADAAWCRRDRFLPDVVSVADAISEACATDEWPVVIGDVADSGGAGTTGDGTTVLAELLRQGAQGAVVGHLVDGDAVAEAARAGVGHTARLTVGGKIDDKHGEPIEIGGKVRAIVDGEFVTSTRFNAGRQRRGPTAVIDCGGVEVILTTRSAHSFEPNTFRSVGIEPSERRILVAKSEMQHRAGLEGIGKTFIDVDAPGISTPFLDRLPYQHRRQPAAPRRATHSNTD